MPKVNSLVLQELQYLQTAHKKRFRKTEYKDLFGTCLHKQVITDAIRDENLLKFGIDYYSIFKHKNKPQFDEMVEDIKKE